jgi:phosphoglycerate dehydrogenase-like enzyme
MTWLVGCPDLWPANVMKIIEAAAPEGFEVEFFDPATSKTPEDLIARSDYLFVGKLRMPAEVINSAPKLRMIQRWGIGFDKVDLDAARAAGVTVAITAGANSDSVAEHVIMLILATHRRLLVADRGVRNGEWVTINGEMRGMAHQILGRTLGIIGFGAIGQAVAQRIVGFGVKVIYYDIRRASDEVEAKYGAEHVTMDELLKRSDIVTIHSGGGESTRHLINADALALMKPDAVLINADRGSIVDEDALYQALTSGRLVAAGLDVFGQEPIDDGNPLLTLDNTVVTPHTAGAVLDNVPGIAAQAFRNMRDHAEGRPIVERDLIV